MPYTVFLKRSAEKELEELLPKMHDKIIAALLSLKDNPFPRNSKKLHGREGVRMRVGNYRVLYIVNDARKTIEVFLSPIGKRSTAKSFSSGEYDASGNHIFEAASTAFDNGLQ